MTHHLTWQHGGIGYRILSILTVLSSI